MKTLVICGNAEDSDYFVRILKANFSKLQIVVTTTGAEGIDTFTVDGPFGFVLIHVNSLRTDAPYTIGEQITEIGGQRPIIYIGTKALIKDRFPKNIFEDNEESKYLYQPFEIDTFKSIINEALQWAKDKAFEESIVEVNRDEFLPLKIKNFYLFNEIPYDAYLEITPTKFVKIIEKYEHYHHGLIDNYVMKKVRFLYLEKEQKLLFLEEAALKIRSILQRNKTAPVNLMKAQIQGVQIVHQYIKTAGFNATVSKLVDDMINTTTQVYAEIKDISKLLSIFPFNNYDISEQSVVTNYLCEAIISKKGWDSTLPRMKLGLSSILHDATIMNEDMVFLRGLNDPNFEKFTEEEQENFKEHPMMASKLAQQFTGIPEADFIVLQHHETPQGRGFPQRLTSLKITPISATFNLASRLSICFNGQKGVGMDIQECISQYATTFNVGNFRDCLKTIKELFG